MIKPFNDCDFVVTFHAETPGSKLVHGWEAVLDYLTKEVNGDIKPGEEGYLDFRDPDFDLNDDDCWDSLHGTYPNNDSERHRYISEIDEGVHLSITRITDYEV